MTVGAGEVGVRRVGEMEDVEGADDDSVVAGPDNAEGLDPLDLVVGDSREVDGLGRSGEDKRVGAVAAVNLAEGEVADGETIVTGPAAQHVDAAAAGECVVAGPADQHLGVAVAVCDHRCRRAAEQATKEDVGFTGVFAAVVSVTCPNDQVVEAVTIDIACSRNTPAGNIACVVALDNETLFHLSAGEIDYLPSTHNAAETRGPAEDNVALDRHCQHMPLQRSDRRSRHR